MDMKKRGQLSTEYLVILGVVVIIALIVIAVLSGFIDIGAGSSTAANDAYWKSAQIGITHKTVYDNGSAQFVLRNNAGKKIRLMEFNIDGTNMITDSNGVVMPLGGTKTISGNVPSGFNNYDFDATFKYEVLQ
jgi:uncharacterized protein (UPF0333 family)